MYAPNSLTIRLDRSVLDLITKRNENGTILRAISLETAFRPGSHFSNLFLNETKFTGYVAPEHDTNL